MRFQVQYWRDADQKWAPTDATVDSGFQPVGSAKYKRRESGWNFSLTPPPEGQTYRLRGIVSYEWRLGKKVVAHARPSARTPGHKDTRARTRRRSARRSARSRADDPPDVEEPRVVRDDAR